jgi:hypothetical protein
MQALSVRQSDRIAKQKVLLIQQQALVADLFRAGQKERARKARDKLYLMLNKLELLEEAVQAGVPTRSQLAPAQEMTGQ